MNKSVRAQALAIGMGFLVAGEPVSSVMTVIGQNGPDSYHLASTKGSAPVLALPNATPASSDATDILPLNNAQLAINDAEKGFLAGNGNTNTLDLALFAYALHASGASNNQTLLWLLWYILQQWNQNPPNASGRSRGGTARSLPQEEVQNLLDKAAAQLQSAKPCQSYQIQQALDTLSQKTSGSNPQLLQILQNGMNTPRGVMAMTLLGDHQYKPALPVVQKALSDTSLDSQVRQNAVMALANIQQSDAVPMLINVMSQDADPAVRDAARRALTSVYAGTLQHPGIDPSSDILQYAQDSSWQVTLPASLKQTWSQAQSLGFSHLMRFDPETQNYINQERLSNQPETDPSTGKQKPLAVFVLPQYDYNNAFAVHSEQEVEAARQAGYRVMVYEAGDYRSLVQDLHNATQAQTADLLVLGAHGESNEMQFGNQWALTTQNKAQLQQDMAGVLSPHAQVVLASCSTGAGNTQTDMAGMFKSLGDVSVIAPEDAALDPLFSFNHQTLTVDYYLPNGKTFVAGPQGNMLIACS